MYKHFSFVTVVACMSMLLFSCTTGEPRILKVNGHTRVYTEKRFCGLPVSTEVETIKTPEERKEDIAIDALEAQQRTEARRATLAMWMGALLLAAAVACAIVAYMTKGWARWGGLAAMCAALGGLCWGFVEWIWILKWFALALPVLAVGLFLYDHRDFELKEWLAKRKGQKDGTQ